MVPGAGLELAAQAIDFNAVLRLSLPEDTSTNTSIFSTYRKRNPI